MKILVKILLAQKHESELFKLFYPSTTLFGVVIGLSGTGKTAAVMDLCRHFPNGVLTK